MASYPVTVYRWDDPGAPQLVDGKISTFFDVLQKCLVDGYGDKAPLGWTRSYYDPVNFKSAWRNSVADGGSGGSCYFYSNTNNDINQTVIRNTSCAAITSAGITTRQNRTVAIQFQTQTTCWVLIGTSIGFYFYTFNPTGQDSKVNSGGAYRHSFYTGDIHSVIPNDAGRFVMLSNLFQTDDRTASNSPAFGLGFVNQTANSISQVIRMYDADGDNSFYNYGYFSSPVTNGNTSDSDESPLIHPKMLVNFLIVPSTGAANSSSLNDRNGTPMKNSSTRPAYRGVVPGFYNTTISFGYNQNLPLLINEGGDNYHTLPSSGAAGSVMLIKTGSWDDPFI